MTKKFQIFIISTFIFLNLFYVSHGLEEYFNQGFDYSGFCSSIPKNFTIDKSLEEIVVKLHSPDGSSIYIYNQPLKDISTTEYISYSNENIYKGKGHFKFIEKDLITYNNSAQAHRITYSRPILSPIENDKNYYYEIHEYFPQKNRVLTFWLKTDYSHLKKYKNILNHIAESTWLYEKKKKDIYSHPWETPVKDTSLYLKGSDFDISIPHNKMAWGIFHSVHPLDPTYLDRIKEFEKKVDKKFEFLMTYAVFDEPMPINSTQDSYNDNRFVMLTSQPWVYYDLKNVITLDILKGKYDNYLRDWAKKLKSIKNPILYRFSNEMNGDWCTWNGWYLGKDPDLYIESWKYVYNIFKEENVDNVYFVWNPHDRSFPDFTWNNPHMYYPGHEYVDFIGLTGYNNGTSHKADKWREFKDIYFPLYAEYMYYYGNKPFLITEFSCNEIGGNKGQWMREGFKFFRDMPNIKMAVWFNQVDKKWAYNIDSTPKSLEAFKEILKYDYFTDSIIVPKKNHMENIDK